MQQFFAKIESETKAFGENLQLPEAHAIEKDYGGTFQQKAPMDVPGNGGTSCPSNTVFIGQPTISSVPPRINRPVFKRSRYWVRAFGKVNGFCL